MGADDFVSKPYEPEMIIRRVAHVSAHAAYIKIMAEKKLEEKLSEIELRSECDELTGLYNRTALEKRVSSYFIGSKRLGAVFIMIDIDNFKNVNDSLGHIRGDDTLMKIADILRGCFRGDDVICRMGGDEFSVFLPAEISSAELNYRLMKLCEQMRIKIGSTEITCSAGACVSPDYGGDYQTLYNNADMALLTAKRKGKNRYQIYNGQSELPTHVLYHNIDWLLDESADAVFICNAESYELLYMNRVAGAMTGKTVRDCIGRKCYEALWNENEPCSYCVKLSANGHEICEREVVPEGSDRRYQIQCRLIDWGGSPARLQYIRDNTKLDTTLRELKEVSEDRKRLLAFVPCGLFRYFADDENDRFDFISENMLIMLGYTRECFDEKFGGRFSNMVWHEDRKRVIDEINAQIAHGDTDYTEYRIEKSDGTLIWARDDGHIVTSEDGTQRFYVAISDITEQKKMEQRLGEGDRSTGQ
ncbi:MAG: diguanylate cyclase, partial [Eubacteriales bacterium]